MLILVCIQWSVPTEVVTHTSGAPKIGPLKLIDVIGFKGACCLKESGVNLCALKRNRGAPMFIRGEPMFLKGPGGTTTH